MEFVTKENRRSGVMSVAGWEAIAVLGYKLVVLSCLAQVAQCDAPPGSSLTLKDYFINAAAPFEASPDASDACIRDTEMFQDGFMNLEMWAVKIYDSTGKPSSGVLRGNTHQLGDYEECIEVKFPSDAKVGDDITVGQYCLATLHVEQVKKDSSMKSERLWDILDSIHSHGAMKSTFEDGPSFFPSFSPISWGVCVPSSCSESDVSLSLASRLASINSSAGGDLSIRVKVERGACEVKKSLNLRPGTIFTVLLFGTFISLAFWGTIYDIKTTEKDGSQSVPKSLFCRILLVYSLRRNVRTLFRTEPEPGMAPYEDISCLHGIRALFSFAIYTIHRIVFGLFMAFTNRTYIAELLEQDWTMLFRAFWNNVDSFVILSGLLTSYFSVKRLQNGRSMNIPKMYLQRYFKFTPMFLAIILSVGHIVEHLHSGPQVLRVINHFIENCQDFSSIIKSIFYVNSFEGMSKMCYPPSHQLVTDMQMYLAAPFFVLALWKWPKRSTLALLALIGALAAYKYAVINTWKLNSVIYNGVTLSEMNIGANLMYLNPLHRLTPYLFGIALGYYLRISGSRSNLSRWQLVVGWCAALWAAYYSFFGAKGAARRGYVTDIAAASLFGAIQPIMWSCALCWVIYVCHVGKARTLNRVLSWKGFVIFSRLSYSVYMVQILVIFFRTGRQMAPYHYNFYSLVDLNELAVVVFLSFFFTLLFFIPLLDLWKVMSGIEITVPSANHAASKGKSEEKEKNGFGDYLHSNPSKPHGLRTSTSFAEKNEEHSSRNT